MRKQKSNLIPNEVDPYLAAVPEPARSTLQKLRATIRSAVPPEATEVISYGIPCLKYKGMLLGYAAFTNHCSLFALNPAVMEQFEEELKNYRTAKGTIQFPLDKPLPATLVKKLAKARVTQNELKQQQRKK